MLKSLLVKDYALIENIFVEFTNGLNIITGETGAGKSILVGALGLLVGERASAEVIRNGASKAVVEGVFEINSNANVEEILKVNEIDFESELIIRREISLKGNNRIFLNDTPTSLQVIKEIGSVLIDMHGQHAHQSLLNVENHILFLDQFGNYKSHLTSFQEKIKLLQEKKHEMHSLIKKENELKEKLDLYQFQLKEINNVNPELNEDVEIENELKILENSEYLFNSTNSIFDAIYDSDDSLIGKLSWLKKELQSISSIDKSFDEQLKEVESAINSVSEIADFTRDYNSSLEVNPEDVEFRRRRLVELNSLKRKYGRSIEQVLDYKKKIVDQINLADNFDFAIDKLYDKIFDLQIDAGELAKEISEKRVQLAQQIIPELETSLQELGMADAKFGININQKTSKSENVIIHDGVNYEFNENGFDNVEFIISTNLGEQLKPLAKIASGGEISRVMLAMKAIAADKDEIPILIFDEIDTGISGRIAEKVGRKMKNLGKTHQVLSITHLPQIAGFGDSHFSIIKENENNRVVSKVILLNEHERINEIAKLVGGEKLTNSAIENAKEFLKISNQD